MRTRIDGAGRVVIPVAMRRAFGIGRNGGELDLVDTADGVLLRPVDHAVAAREERGLTVASVGRPVERSKVAAAIRRDREDRPAGA